MQNKSHWLPNGKAQTITVIALIIELIFIMPYIIGKMADRLNQSSFSAASIWSIISLVMINVIWFITWLIAYRYANDYLTNVIKIRNVRMALLIIGTFFTLETVLINNYAFVAVFSIIAYVTLWAWFDYLFAHPNESDVVIEKTQRFVRDHKHLNRSEVQRMINDNNKNFIKRLYNDSNSEKVSTNQQNSDAEHDKK